MGGSGNFRGGFNNSSNAAANPMMANPAMGMMRGGGGMMNPNLLGGMMTAAGELTRQWHQAMWDNYR